MDKQGEKILILGIGNDILKDDGIGPRLVKDLQKEAFPEVICFKTSSMGGLEILELIREYHTVLILDAIKTKDGIPGEVYYFKPVRFS